MIRDGNLQANQTGLPDDLVKQLPGIAFSKGLSNHGKLSPVFTDQKSAANQGFGPRYNFYTARLVVGITPVVILGASMTRVSVLIQNLGSADIYLGYGSVPDAANQDGIKLVPDAVISDTDGIVPSNEIQAVSGTAGQVITVRVGIPV